MCLLPLAGQYEQITNAHYIQKLGLGVSAKKLDEKNLARFLGDIERPLPDDQAIIWPDNKKFFQTLQVELNKLKYPIDITLA
jgi:hypothetical protein